MNDGRERLVALEYIRGLTEKDFADFFYEAVTDKNHNNFFDDGYEKERYCLVQSSFGSFRNKVDEEHHSEFMALPTTQLAELEWVKNETQTCEQGQCEKCKAFIICVAKQAVCPVCDTIVECT